MYKITKYSFDKAKLIGVQIKPSTVKNKKIDVYIGSKKITTIGDSRYSDFATTQNKEQRRLYRIRHAKNIAIKGSRGWYASEILW